MHSDLYTVSKLFTERLFRIPDYQRGYAWSDRQLKDFWSDLMQLDQVKSHYLGVLTLEDVSDEQLNQWPEDRWIIESKGYMPFYVVDGQQRLTTTIILIKTISEFIPKDGKLNYTTVSDIRKKFLWDSKDDEISRSYIFGYEKDNPSYEFLKTGIFQEFSTSSSTPQQTIYTSNLEKAKLFFKEKLSDMDYRELEVLYRKITQQLIFNIYAISKEVDVFVAFETMNNRGKPLSHLELLKNRLIYLSTKLDVPTYERGTLRTNVNESWKSIYHYLGKNKYNPLDDDSFLRTHFLLYFGGDFLDENDEFKSYRHIRRQYMDSYKDYLLESYFTTKNLQVSSESSNALTVEKVNEYAKSLKISVEFWYEILNPMDSKFSESERLWLVKLNRLGITYVAPLIMIYMQKVDSVDKRVQFLKLLEQILFLNIVVRYRNFMEFDPYSFLILASKLSAGIESHEKISKELSAACFRMKSDKELWNNVEKQFKSSGYYDWPGIKYFLYEYDQSLKDLSKTSRDKINWETFIEDDKDLYSVEHIYPQRPRKPCWTDLYNQFSSKERSLLRHSLGNLVPLSKAKNSSLQNKCFSDKKAGQDNAVGFSFGSYAENEIALKQEWSAEDILERGLKLLDFMEKRWKLSLGNHEEKVRMLGLEFMLKNK